jgi:hypothetical protein
MAHRSGAFEAQYADDAEPVDADPFAEEEQAAYRDEHGAQDDPDAPLSDFEDERRQHEQLADEAVEQTLDQLAGENAAFDALMRRARMAEVGEGEGEGGFEEDEDELVERVRQGGAGSYYHREEHKEHSHTETHTTTTSSHSSSAGPCTT